MINIFISISLITSCSVVIIVMICCPVLRIIFLSVRHVGSNVCVCCVVCAAVFVILIQNMINIVCVCVPLMISFIHMLIRSSSVSSSYGVCVCYLLIARFVFCSYLFAVVLLLCIVLLCVVLCVCVLCCLLYIL